MDQTAEEIALATALTLLALFGEHYAPWRKWLGRPLGKLAAYVAGTLAMVLPYTWLLVRWHGWGREVTSLWVIVVAAGLLVIIVNLADGKRDAEDTQAWQREEIEEWRDAPGKPRT